MNSFKKCATTPKRGSIMAEGRSAVKTESHPLNSYKLVSSLSDVNEAAVLSTTRGGGHDERISRKRGSP